MILDQIVADVRQRLVERKQLIPVGDFESLLDNNDTTRDFKGALQGEGIEIIAEIKRASPSKGWLCRDLDVATLAQSYAQGGAAAISVLTEPDWFKGGLANLAIARQVVDLPLLCKDFILESYQILEARFFGADAVLLIASLLSLSELSDLIGVARGLKMSALVEVHNEEEMEKALDAGSSLIGINNRDLTDFSVNLGTTLRLCPLIPSGITIVSESGIKSYDDLATLKAAGVNAVLIGETLVSSPDPEAKLRELREEHN